MALCCQCDRPQTEGPEAQPLRHGPRPDGGHLPLDLLHPRVAIYVRCARANDRHDNGSGQGRPPPSTRHACRVSLYAI